jgi:hypothetical protein
MKCTTNGIPTINTAITTVAIMEVLDERNLRRAGGPGGRESRTRSPEMNAERATLLNIYVI